MKSHPSINITITTWNRLLISRLCIELLLQTNVMGATIRIIDNGSTEGAREYLSQLKKQHSNLEVYLFLKNYGIAVASNLGWSLSNSDYYVKVGDDINILDEKWLEYLISFLQRNDEVSMIGYRCLDSIDTHQSSYPQAILSIIITVVAVPLFVFPKKYISVVGFGMKILIIMDMKTLITVA